MVFFNSTEDRLYSAAERLRTSTTPEESEAAVRSFEALSDAYEQFPEHIKKNNSLRNLRAYCGNIMGLWD